MSNDRAPVAFGSRRRTMVVLSAGVLLVGMVCVLIGQYLRWRAEQLRARRPRQP